MRGECGFKKVGEHSPRFARARVYRSVHLELILASCTGAIKDERRPGFSRSDGRLLRLLANTGRKWGGVLRRGGQDHSSRSSDAWPKFGPPYTDQRWATEVEVAVHLLNRMLELGRPTYVRIA